MGEAPRLIFITYLTGIADAYGTTRTLQAGVDVGEWQLSLSLGALGIAVGKILVLLYRSG